MYSTHQHGENDTDLYYTTINVTMLYLWNILLYAITHHNKNHRHHTVYKHTTALVQSVWINSSRDE